MQKEGSKHSKECIQGFSVRILEWYKNWSKSNLLFLLIKGDFESNEEFIINLLKDISGDSLYRPNISILNNRNLKSVYEKNEFCNVKLIYFSDISHYDYVQFLSRNLLDSIDVPAIFRIKELNILTRKSSEKISRYFQIIDLNECVCFEKNFKNFEKDRIESIKNNSNYNCQLL